MKIVVHLRNGALMLGIFLAVIGCQKTLYNELKEKEANEMIVLLMERGISSEKIYDDRSGKVSLEVAGGDVAEAITTLRDNGYPRDEHTNLGEVFSKNSLISSPTEEHARYTYALSEDLSQTLSELDGVIHAKVHLVLPKTKGRKQTPSSAAVFIKHSASVKMSNFIPQIKLLIQGSVEGLKYEDVNVALFPAIRAARAQAASSEVTSIFSISVLESSSNKLMAVFGLLLFAIALVALFVFMQARKNIASLNPSGLTRSEG